MQAASELGKVFLFRDVPDPILALLETCVERRTVPAGDTILAEGTPSDSLFMVASGSVRAFHRGEPLVLTMGPGESFGHLMLLTGGPSDLSVVAVERTDLLVLPAASLRERLAGNDAVGFALFRALARTLAARLRRALGSSLHVANAEG